MTLRSLLRRRQGHRDAGVPAVGARGSHRPLAQYLHRGRPLCRPSALCAGGIRAYSRGGRPGSIDQIRLLYQRGVPADPETWLERATQHPGSWWPTWADWQTQFAGGKVKPRVPAKAGLPALEEAPPGSYVKVASLTMRTKRTVSRHPIHTHQIALKPRLGCHRCPLEIEIGGQHDHVANRHAAWPRQHEHHHVRHFAGLQQTSRLPGFLQLLRRPVREQCADDGAGRD